MVVTSDGEMLLPVPVLDLEGDLWLPMVFLEQVVGPQTRERVAWDAGKPTAGPGQRRLQRGPARGRGSGSNHRGAHLLPRTPGISDQQSAHRRHRREDLRGRGQHLGGAVLQAGGVWSSRSASRQHRDHATVTINVDQLVGRYRTYTADEGREIVVVLEEEQVSSMPDPVPRGHANVNIDQGPVDVTNRIDVQTVVVDAGHGGHDVGAVSRRGIMEKDVNLAVAKELRRYLERESDLKVILTRDNDSYLELPDRAEIANSSGGDLFLSLHCNSWFNDGAHGLETYFLSPARSDWAKSVEAAENQAGRSLRVPTVNRTTWSSSSGSWCRTGSSPAAASWPRPSRTR